MAVALFSDSHAGIVPGDSDVACAAYLLDGGSGR